MVYEANTLSVVNAGFTDFQKDNLSVRFVQNVNS